MPTLAQPQFWSGTRDFGAVSASRGIVEGGAGWTLGVSVRAPNARLRPRNCLPTARTPARRPLKWATNLKNERATSVEALVRGGGDAYSIELSAYHSWFADFIYEDPPARPTGCRCIA
jgi:iron complex outermembrane receptor protein